MTFMRMAVLATAPLALAATPASATKVFTFDLTGAYSAQFSITKAAFGAPVDASVDGFIVEDVAGVYGGKAQRAPSITFATDAFGGGMTIELLSGAFAGFLGEQLFTGTTAMPVARTGTFTLRSDVDGALATLVVAQADAVPEPATWALMIAGFAAVAGAMRRRSAVRTAVRFA